MKILTFNNNTEVLQYFEKNKKKIEKTMTYQKKANEFTNFRGNKDCLHDLKYGNHNYNKNFIDALVDYETDNQTEYIPAPVGMFYDMGAVIEGNPEPAYNEQKTDNKKELKIYIDLSINGGTKNNYLLNKGLAIFNLIYTLQQKNYILDVNFIVPTVNKDGKSKKFVIVYKIPINELNLSTIAFYTSPEFFRRITFIIAEVNEIYPYETEGYYPEQLIKDGFYIPTCYTKNGFNNSINNNYRTKEQAENFINNLFNNYMKEGKNA